MTIDYKRKLVSLITPKGEKLEHKGINPQKAILIISAMQAFRMMREGCHGYLCVIEVVTSDEHNLSEKPVANEFLEMFEDAPGLPPDQKIEFTIDLVAGITPISKAPY